MKKDSIKIGWTKNNEEVLGSAVDYKTSNPLGSLSIVLSDRGYEITTYSFFNGKIKVQHMHKHQAIPNIKGLARAMMFASLGVNY